MTTEIGLGSARQITDHIERLQTRMVFLKGRIEAHGGIEEARYDRDEYHALIWALPVLEAERDDLIRLRKAVAQANRSIPFRASLPFVVAFDVPHSEGVEQGVIHGPGFSSGTSLVDLYEVDASIKSFFTKDEAETWLSEMRETDV